MPCRSVKADIERGRNSRTRQPHWRGHVRQSDRSPHTREKGVGRAEVPMSNTPRVIIYLILCCAGQASAAAQEGWAPEALVACPAAGDTLWASESTAPPPRIWIIGALRNPCWKRFTDRTRERVFRSSAAQEFYVRFLTAADS